MDKFVKYYWKKTWMFNLVWSLLVLWTVVDTIRGSALFYCYFALVIFAVFIMWVRLDLKKKFLYEKKLMRQGLMV